MKKQFSWSREGNTLRLFGKLDQYVLHSLWDKRFEAMQSVTLIDLSAVVRVDTAGLALLVYLIDTGKKQGRRVLLTGISNNVLPLARLYNLPEDMLPC